MDLDKSIIKALTDYTMRHTGCKEDEIEVKKIGELNYEITVTPKKKAEMLDITFIY